MTDYTAYIRQLEFQLEKAERGMGMPYSREDVAHYRRLIIEAMAAAETERRMGCVGCSS